MALLDSDFAFARLNVTELSVWLASFFLWILSSVRRNASKFSINFFLNHTGLSLLFCSLALVLCIIIIVAMYLFFAGWLRRRFVCLLWSKRQSFASVFLIHMILDFAL